MPLSLPMSCKKECQLSQAPVPYLNRAIAEEQLGVNAASAGKTTEAAEHYQAAIQVCSVVGSSLHPRFCLTILQAWGLYRLLVMS